MFRVKEHQEWGKKCACFWCVVDGAWREVREREGMGNEAGKIVFHKCFHISYEVCLSLVKFVIEHKPVDMFKGNRWIFRNILFFENFIHVSMNIYESSPSHPF